MIELINVSKYYPTEFGRHYVFRDVNLRLPLDKSVGVMGPNGAGKSTFLRLIAGADVPSEGKIIRTGRISPPMGLTPSIMGTLTGAENARFACRIYGMDRDEMEDVVEEVGRLADIGKFYNMPVGTYSAGMKQRVAFAISMSMHYDYYLFDEIGAGGDRQFREISKRLVKERLATSKFIITSHRIDELIELCEACIVIMNGELRYFDKMDEALSFYGETYDLRDVHEKIERKARRAAKKERATGEPESEASKEERRAARKAERKARKAEAKEKALAKKKMGLAAMPVDPQPDVPVLAPVAVAITADAPAEHQPAPDPERDARRAARKAEHKLRKLAAAAPDFPVPGTGMDGGLDGDAKLARFQSRFAGDVAAPVESAAATEALPAKNKDVKRMERHQRRADRKAERLARAQAGASEPDDAVELTSGLAGAVTAQVLAAAKASRSQRLLMRLLDGEGQDDIALHEQAVGIASEAQAAAARAARHARAWLETSEPALPATAAATDDDREQRRAARRALRQQQRLAEASQDEHHS